MDLLTCSNGCDAFLKSFVRRNAEGAMDPEGTVWGVPYRWGSLVFAYRKDKLEKNGVEPIKVRYFTSNRSNRFSECH